VIRRHWLLKRLGSIWSFPSVRGALEGNKGKPKRNVLIQPGQDATTELTAVAAPHVPPEILQTAGRGIPELLIGDGIDWESIRSAGKVLPRKGQLPCQ
jgi:hypothetical protein